MKQLIRLLLGVIPSLFLACDYSPSGSHYEDIKPLTEVEAHIFLNDNPDTVFARGQPSLSYHVHMPGRTFYQYVLTLNGEVIRSGTKAGDNFYFPAYQYADGFYTLQLTGIAATGTGSLADVNKLEGVVVYRTWIMQIDNAPPSSIAITSVAPKDGLLEVTWEHYGKRKGFTSYKLFRNNIEVATITDPNTTSWTDQSYIGGPITYAIETYAASYAGNKTTTRGPVYAYHYPLPRILSSTFDEEKGISATFSSTPFYRAFLGYTVSANPGYDRYEHKKSSVSDTVFTFPNPGFGVSVQATLYTHARNVYGYVPTAFTEAKLASMADGTWGPYTLSLVARRASTDLFYVQGNNDITILDAASLQVKQVRQMRSQWSESNAFRYRVSENGNHFYVLQNGSLQKLHPSTLQTQNTHTLQQLLPASKYNHMEFYVSNNNRVAIQATNSSTQKDTVYLFDMDRQKILTKYPLTGIRNAILSPDGKLLRIDGRLLTEQPDGSWAQLGAPSVDYNWLKFHPSNPLFMIKKGAAISFYSTASGALQRTIQTEIELTDFEIDAGSGNLYGIPGVGHDLNIYNSESGQLIRKVKLSSFVREVMLYKNRIFTDRLYADL